MQFSGLKLLLCKYEVPCSNPGHSCAHQGKPGSCIIFSSHKWPQRAELGVPQSAGQKPHLSLSSYTETLVCLPRVFIMRSLSLLKSQSSLCSSLSFCHCPEKKIPGFIYMDGNPSSPQRDISKQSHGSLHASSRPEELRHEWKKEDQVRKNYWEYLQ